MCCFIWRNKEQELYINWPQLASVISINVTQVQIKQIPGKLALRLWINNSHKSIKNKDIDTVNKTQLKTMYLFCGIRCTSLCMDGLNNYVKMASVPFLICIFIMFIRHISTMLNIVKIPI